MTSPPQANRRKFSGKAPLNSCRKLHNSQPEKHSGNVDRRFVSTPMMPKMQTNDTVLRPSKLLLKVTIENSLGAIQMLMLSEDTVEDLIKAALVFYEKDKRRPILKNTDPRCYDLHYSQFTFQSLKRDEKLVGLESRNFFLCSKPPVSSCTMQNENMAMDSSFPWMILLNFLL
ncbi:hypothetical protein MtrunA17_Chr4g0056791 [Medicago truncatula]|uniref:DUF7054 domain-containing protein n=1 Tax=Medicago truncatula TaxID=3880 RepID=G7JK81_MEDTR|nr:uncharacterized protein LOC11415625 isoform X1 [Medicago truncatula]AES90993.1 hypothetical protein MTR_4g102040 [Medicago truncatula]RHN63298.1 hypothetical protein MtrunA17_Chr4g0056791 [Medicago truncatula]